MLNQQLPTDIQKIQFLEKYSRWDWESSTRETFEEACQRCIDFARFHTVDRLPQGLYEELHQGMLELKAFPSLRYFQVAGPEAVRHPQSIFNCAFLPVTDIASFSETMFLLGLGVGVGYSVERQWTYRLPEVQSYPIWAGTGRTEVVVKDSLEGWAHALQQALQMWWNGIDAKLNFAEVRPAGAPLKSRGGFASGPEPFENAANHIREIIFNAAGRRLTNLELHDIQCHIASAIVSGGYRRSAMISLFDRTDDEMFNAKMGDWYSDNPQRSFANNSMVMTREMSESWWRKKLYEIGEGGYGEPGVFSRYAANLSKPKRRKEAEFGTNPCGEVSLRPFEFCNLTIANVREEDSVEDIKEKARLAAIWGTIQASFGPFPNIRREWTVNQIEERLLGVDLNGQRDNAMFSDSETVKEFPFEEVTRYVNMVNGVVAEKLGIRPAAASTCAKPAGNSSTMFDTASGIRRRHAAHYIRRVQILETSPMAMFLASQGVPNDRVSYTTSPTLAFEFPVKAPDHATVFAGEDSVEEQLAYWKEVKTRYTEHNPSVTIDYRDKKDLRTIGAWITANQDIINGLSFFPFSDVKYDNAPYETIDEDAYNIMSEKLNVDWDLYPDFDTAAMGSGGREMACAGGACEL